MPRDSSDLPHCVCVRVGVIKGLRAGGGRELTHLGQGHPVQGAAALTEARASHEGRGVSQMRSQDGRARYASERLDDVRGARLSLLHAAAMSLHLLYGMVSVKFKRFPRG